MPIDEKIDKITNRVYKQVINGIGDNISGLQSLLHPLQMTQGLWHLACNPITYIQKAAVFIWNEPIRAATNFSLNILEGRIVGNILTINPISAAPSTPVLTNTTVCTPSLPLFKTPPAYGINPIIPGAIIFEAEQTALNIASSTCSSGICRLPTAVSQNFAILPPAPPLIIDRTSPAIKKPINQTPWYKKWSI